jgi:hypothetical protein
MATIGSFKKSGREFQGLPDLLHKDQAGVGQWLRVPRPDDTYHPTAGRRYVDDRKASTSLVGGSLS